MRPVRKQLSDTPPSLVSELAEFFARRGFTLHRCCHPGGDGQDHNTGGVCVTPEPSGTVLVGWSTHTALEHAEPAQRANVRVELIALFRAWLDRANYRTEPGPVGRSVRVLASPPGMDQQDGMVSSAWARTMVIP